MLPFLSGAQSRNLDKPYLLQAGSIFLLATGSEQIAKYRLNTGWLEDAIDPLKSSSMLTIEESFLSGNFIEIVLSAFAYR